MKKIFTRIILMLLICVMMMPLASAVVPFATYTYDIDGEMMPSPHAFVPDFVIDSSDIGLRDMPTEGRLAGRLGIGLEIPLSSPQDIVVDIDENVYIADTKNSRIIILDTDFKLIGVLDSFLNEYGVPDALDQPNGLFVTEDEIYVADTESNRVVIFSRDDFSFKRVVGEPRSQVFPEGHIYKPVALSVDKAGRIYVVSSTTHYGIISMNNDGGFNGFLGAQKVKVSAFDVLWRQLMTDEQRSYSQKFVPTEYNNITIDSSGFIYVTTSSIDADAQQSAIESKSRSSDYAPVKKLNPLGEDVMSRTGFYPPSGEVNVSKFEAYDTPIYGASKIVDVALGPNGMWSIVDEKRQKIFTYDEQGKLLFVFGDIGTQIGNFQSISSIAYKGNDLLVLDDTSGSITVMKRTEYGDIIAGALQNKRDREYDKAVEYWKDILQRNANFDMSYVGIGDSLYRERKYTEAMETYTYAYAVEDYSKCFKNIRKQWIERWILLIPIVIVVVCVACSKFLGYAAKVNKAGQVMKEKRTFKEAFLYGFHVIFHPFDGFWDLKHEKRGNMKGAMAIVAITILGFIYQSLGQSYIANPYLEGNGILMEVLSILLPYVLWCVANWALTTLFDGEGSMRDIFIATGYSLLPLPLLIVPATIMTNFLGQDEMQICSMLVSIGFIWSFGLIFFGTMVTHDYSLGKNVLTVIGTIVAMAFIMFMGVLFSGLVTKMFSFVYSIFVEVSYRM
ncbi:MAG: YIP1 family protein [Clostridia bacterium]|nr:YIP1 family protein [Clostridia bacterium]